MQIGHNGIPKSRTLSHGDYTIGWICSLPFEIAAAKAMMDEVHLDLLPDGCDDNSYILGRVHCHNVVVACLPTGAIGPTPAATVATKMLSTFPMIRYGLLVGIGGGVPAQTDIRLGDVVVGKPVKGRGAVIQYDHSEISGQLSPLNNPPHALLTALSKLQAIHLVEGNQIAHLLSEMVTKHPLLKDMVTPKSPDRLFIAAYRHNSSRHCGNCDRTKLVRRPARTKDAPQVHYGVIASSNCVMKNSLTRDRLASQHGIICFEMEAAGLMNTFPCLVIRGISDYADSHKNDDWQGYAAATAAAYAKELLLLLPAKKIG
ncbi:nucleoside phosphorylase domain-containing protein [Aspergillus ambiguus]|uniref:5'-methylthioadenosine/S-adenosylhomocysteine nucleosidase family protein n=1 Tax=Aspergillus ambiguus TaxID=176160 RepID=UPI003CCD9403